jgi:hypothetical protein
MNHLGASSPFFAAHTHTHFGSVRMHKKYYEYEHSHFLGVSPPRAAAGIYARAARINRIFISHAAPATFCSPGACLCLCFAEIAFGGK